LFPAGLAAGAALCPLPAGRAAVQTPAVSPGPATSQPSARPASDVLYAQGCAQLQAGDAAAAIPLLTRAVAQRPDNLDYAVKLAEAHAAAGQTSAALRLLNDLAARHPDQMALRVARAEVHALDRDWTAVEEALAPLEDGLDADGLVLLANACAQRSQAARARAILQRGLKRLPQDETLWLALIDHALDSEQCALALQRVRQARRHLAPSPRLEFRAAQAYYRLGQALGQTRVIRMPDGRAGQFVNDWLLVEKRAEPDRFLCCPKASALYALRRALDAGLDEPAAHLLHARIWQQAGRPGVGLAILQSREALLLDRTPSASAESRRHGGPRPQDATPEILATFADLALAANALDDFLRYTRLRAARQPQRRTEILYDAFVAAAERYNQRGDEVMYRELLRRALALRSDDVDLMLRLADALWDAGEGQAATIWYRRVLERQPAHRDRSRILKRLEG
jgi:tetratricopeptide (TPR) repeat protein